MILEMKVPSPVIIFVATLAFVYTLYESAGKWSTCLFWVVQAAISLWCICM